MKLDEIIAYNKVNLERCTEKQATFIKDYMRGVKCSDTDYLFVSECMFFKYVRRVGHYELVQQPVPKYICSVLYWNKETDRCKRVHQFGFNNRNRLRNRIAALQKENKDIVCRIISINK